jgi:uncharacterized protein (TIGR02466 family)
VTDAPKNEVFGLFPTPFMFCKQVLSAEQCGQLIQHQAASATQPNHHSKDLIHTEISFPEDGGFFSDVTRRINAPLVEMGSLMFGEKLKWHIKEIWMNFLKPEGGQAMHNHANSFISGVLYLTPTHPASRTVFFRGFGDRGFVFTNTHQGTETGEFNAEKWIAPEPDAGDMILFPSYLLHAVPMNQGDLRISLAFNAIPERLQSWGYGISLSN